jgi:hypothetical protein
MMNNASLVDFLPSKNAVKMLSITITQPLTLYTTNPSFFVSENRSLVSFVHFNHNKHFVSLRTHFPRPTYRYTDTWYNSIVSLNIIQKNSLNLCFPFVYCRNYINDSLRTDVFLRFPPETIACACIDLAARNLQVRRIKYSNRFILFFR